MRKRHLNRDLKEMNKQAMWLLEGRAFSGSWGTESEKAWDRSMPGMSEEQHRGLRASESRKAGWSRENKGESGKTRSERQLGARYCRVGPL